MSQQEDDLRALAKIMDLLRAISIAVVVGNIYWFCRELVDGWRFHAETMKVLTNFNEACGMFHNPWNAKWWALLFLGLSCFGSSIFHLTTLRRSSSSRARALTPIECSRVLPASRKSLYCPVGSGKFYMGLFNPILTCF